MKRITSKLKKKEASPAKPARITNETVAEHRERVLAEGRRFKYPVQYTKHKLVFTAIAIGLSLAILFVGVSWWQLYKAQTTDTFYYRVTRTLPLPVASVDGEKVKYGDYLLNYKMSETYLNTTEKANEAQYVDDSSRNGLYDFYKAQAMNDAVADAYAQKIAKSNNITVTDKQIDDAFAATRQLSDGTQISQEVLDRSNEQKFGISPEDSRYLMRKALLRKAVEYKLDTKAADISHQIEKAVSTNPDMPFEEILANINKQHPDAVQMASTGWVKKTNPDGGVTAAAAKLKKGQVSAAIKPDKGDGYYFIKLLDTNAQGEIDYQFLKVPLKQFKNQMTELKSQSKIHYYINVPETQAPTQAK